MPDDHQSRPAAAAAAAHLSDGTARPRLVHETPSDASTESAGSTTSNLTLPSYSSSSVKSDGITEASDLASFHNRLSHPSDPARSLLDHTLSSQPSPESSTSSRHRHLSSPMKLDLASTPTLDNLREAVTAAQVSSFSSVRSASPVHRPADDSTAFSSAPAEFISPYEELEFPTPKLYDLALKLNADPGLDGFWTNLTDILETFYTAKRASLVVPNDLTDVANTPWGLKGMWTSKNLPWALAQLQHHRGSQVAASVDHETGDASDPGETDEHNEDSWEDMFDDSDAEFHDNSSRQSPAAEYATDRPSVHRLASDATIVDDRTDLSDNEGIPFLARQQADVDTGTAKVYSALRPLDSDVDPLIDSLGVSRVLHRGKFVLLQREYRNLVAPNRDSEPSTKPERPTLPHRNAFTDRKAKFKKSGLKPALRDPFDDARPNHSEVTFTDLPYEDYEQALLSPWSHSPAPSPAVSKDSKENPFFHEATVMDDAFASPNQSPQEDIHAPVRAIGLESSYSIIHIPLIHPSIARSARTTGTRRRDIVPIAILSILTDVIPYQTNLIKSLSALAPHVAASFALADAHSNLKYQIDMTQKSYAHRHRHRHHDKGHRMSRMTSTTSSSRSASHRPSVSSSYFGLNQLSDSADSSAASTPTWDSAGPGSTTSPSATSPAATNIYTRHSPVTVTAASLPSTYTKKHRPIRPTSASRHASPPPTSPVSSFTLAPSPAPQVERRRSDEMHHMFPPSPRLLRTIIDSIPVHLYVAEPGTGKVTWVSARTLAYSGISPEEFCNSPLGSRFHPEDQSTFDRAWQSAFKNGESLSLQLRLRRFDGAYRYFVVRAVPLRNSKGAIVHWFGTNIDIHDQRQAESNAIKQAEKLAGEKKYRTLAESSPLIVFTATEMDGVLYANNQWTKYSGQTLDEACKFGFFECVHPDDRALCILPSGRKESRFSSEIRLRNVLGEYRWHLVRCVCTDLEGPEESAAESGAHASADPNAGDLAWFGTCTDINDHKMVEEKLQEAKDAAQRTMESKARFLSNMSHEIRTPLIGISGMVNFLMDTTLTGEQLDYCHTISSSSEALLSVINDILDLSKAEAGKMRLNKEWFHIRWLIEDANELLSTLAISKNLELNYIVEEDVPPVVNGDRIRIRQVLLNIIGNAIKFTTRGEVFTRCSVLSRGKGTIVLHFECHDTGAGFAKEDEVLMFKPFSQIDGTMTRKQGGSGLGLVISRQLIELHGGTINCRGEKGRGSTFYFSAEFGLPTDDDHPSRSPRLRSVRYSSMSSSSSDNHVSEKASPMSARPGSNPGSNSTPLPLPSPISEYPLTATPPSPGNTVHSPAQERLRNQIKPANDPKSMRFKIPADPHRRHRAEDAVDPDAAEISQVQKPTVFALIVCEYPFTTEAIIHHIREALPTDTVLETAHALNVVEACELVNVLGAKMPDPNDRQPFTHVVINVADYTEIVSLAAKVLANTVVFGRTKVVAVTTPMQKTAIMHNLRADAAGTVSTIPDKNPPTSIAGISGYDLSSAAMSSPAGASSHDALIRSETLVDYKILEREFSQRFFCVSKPIKVSRLAPMFNPGRGGSNASSTGSSLPSVTSFPLSGIDSAAHEDAKYKEVEFNRRKESSRQSLFRELQNAVEGRNIRVLLVEDNPVNQKVLHQFLVRGGMTVDSVADGEECVSKVFSSDLGYYNLIICDLHMPRKDGFQTCAEIRRWEEDNEAEVRCPIIALSANVMSDVAERCATVGFSRYVSKPIDFTVFKDLLNDERRM